jgi:hypothetical protein
VDADYCIVSEAVGPGFDVHDFHFVTAKDLDEEQLDDETRNALEPYLNLETSSTVSVSTAPSIVDEKNKVFDKHYD